MKNRLNLTQVHTVMRTILLVDIPAAAFLLACAIIGWPIAITRHELFFWIGLIAFGSIAVIGIAKLESKTLIPIGRDRETFRIEMESQRQQLLSLPYPTDEDARNLLLSNRPVAQPGQVRTQDTVLGQDANVLDEDVVEAPQLTQEELIFYRNEKYGGRHGYPPKLSDLQLCASLGYSQDASGQRRVRRLRERMNREGKMA